METQTIKLVFEKALEVMVKTTPIIGGVASVLLESAKDADIASESGDITKLIQEAKRQEISLQMAKMQAQVAQELAIAHRIENAEEVEIEEYYEGTGKAGAGLSADGTSASFTLGVEERKVVKRVYRFTGNSTLKSI